MEGLGNKIKNAVIAGAAILVMGKGGEELRNYQKNAIVTEKASSGRSKTGDNTEILEQAKNKLEYALKQLKKNPQDLINGNMIIDDEGNLVNIFDVPGREITTSAQRKWMITILKNPEYQKRALAEGVTQSEIDNRIRKVMEVPIFEEEKETVTGLPNASGAAFTRRSGEPIRIHVGKGKANEEANNSVIVHELDHASTGSDQGLSQKAKRLYKESFGEFGKSFVGNTPLAREKFLNYLKTPTERSARKRQLEYDMERLGVKKYEEKFTEEHYQKILELEKQGKLSKGSMEFIYTTKPEYFIRIMNEIADTKEFEDADDVPPYNLPTEYQG